MSQTLTRLWSFPLAAFFCPSVKFSWLWQKAVRITDSNTFKRYLYVIHRKACYPLHWHSRQKSSSRDIQISQRWWQDHHICTLTVLCTTILYEAVPKTFGSCYHYLVWKLQCIYRIGMPQKSIDMKTHKCVKLIRREITLFPLLTYYSACIAVLRTQCTWL